MRAEAGGAGNALQFIAILLRECLKREQLS